MGRDRINSVESILSAIDPALVEGDQAGPNKNVYLLAITTALFTSFVIAEVIGALAGHSLALLGDASAMSVDVFSYLCSWYGETVKAKNNGILDEGSRMLVEVYIPTFSLIALLAVSGYVVSDAIAMIISKDPNKEDEVNVVFLFAFSGANMFVDVISIVLFYLQRHEVFKVDDHHSGLKKTHSFARRLLTRSLSGSSVPINGRSFTEPNMAAPLLAINEEEEEVLQQIEEQRSSAAAIATEPVQTSIYSSSSAVPVTHCQYSTVPQVHSEGETARHTSPTSGVSTATDRQQHLATHVDINLASALTHVGGDSMRTMSVFVAAIVSACGFDPNLCDAWATTVVTVSILCMVIPLASVIWKAARKHIAAAKEENIIDVARQKVLSG